MSFSSGEYGLGNGEYVRISTSNNLSKKKRNADTREKDLKNTEFCESWSCRRGKKILNSGHLERIDDSGNQDDGHNSYFGLERLFGDIIAFGQSNTNGNNNESHKSFISLGSKQNYGELEYCDYCNYNCGDYDNECYNYNMESDGYIGIEESRVRTCEELNEQMRREDDMYTDVNLDIGKIKIIGVDTDMDLDLNQRSKRNTVTSCHFPGIHDNSRKEKHLKWDLDMKASEYGMDKCIFNSTEPNFSRKIVNMLEKYPQKQRKIPVICIEDGVVVQNYMQTTELLRKVHMHNEKQILEEKATGALTLRDLRQVVGLHGFERPSIEIRRNCILVNMLGVRCLILHNKVYYLPRKPALFSNNEFIGHNITDYHDRCIVEKLLFATKNYKTRESSEGNCDENDGCLNNKEDEGAEDKENEEHKVPLELNALEICLVQVCTQLWDNYYKIYKTAQGFLVHIENNPTSTQKVYEINELRKRLDSLRDRIKGVYEAIKEILDDDDLLVRIEISKFWKKPQNWDNITIHESSFFDSEILLECYEQEVEGLTRTVNRLNAQLDDAIEVMQIHLATIRNNFLKGEISLDIVGVCVGFVSAIASIFGMNIQSGLEKNMGIFWFMAYTMITMCAFAGIIVILMFRRLQL